MYAIITMVQRVPVTVLSAGPGDAFGEGAMKASLRLTSWFLAAVVVSAWCPLALGGPGAKIETDPAVLLEAALVVKELGFTVEQEKDLKEIVDKLKVAIGKWDADNRAEYAEIKRKYEASLKSGSSTKMREAMSARKALDRRRTYLIDSYKRRVGRLFTPDQAIGWESHKLYVEMFDRYRRWNLTSKQMEKPKDGCFGVAVVMIDVNKRGDMVGVMRLRTSLQRHIVADIFTDAQRKKIEAPPPMSKQAREEAAERKAKAKIAFQAFVNKQEIREAYRSLKITNEMADLMVAHNVRKAEEARRNWNKVTKKRYSRRR